MICGDLGLLRAYLDRELSCNQETSVDTHLSGCPTCREHLAELERAAGFADSRLSILSPGVAEASTQHRIALGRLRSRSTAGVDGGSVITRMRRMLVKAPYLPRIAAMVAGVLVLVTVLLLSPLEIAAEDFLSVFRVRQFAPVRLEPSELSGLPNPHDLGTLVAPDDVQFSELSLSEATQLTGIELLTVKDVPVGLQEHPTIMVSDPIRFSFTYDAEKLEAYYRQTGATGEPPLELAGLTMRVSIPPVALTSYTDPDADSGNRQPGEMPSNGRQRFLLLAQVRSPEVELPAGVDADGLHDQVLMSAPLPPQMLAQLGAITDWQDTLPVPVVEGEPRDVAVDGVTGLLVFEPEMGAYLLWEKDGVVRALFGTVSEDELLAAASSLAR